jgi:hypothetical protein
MKKHTRLLRASYEWMVIRRLLQYLLTSKEFLGRSCELQKHTSCLGWLLGHNMMLWWIAEYREEIWLLWVIVVFRRSRRRGKMRRRYGRSASWLQGPGGQVIGEVLESLSRLAGDKLVSWRFGDIVFGIRRDVLQRVWCGEKMWGLNWRWGGIVVLHQMIVEMVNGEW